MKRTLILFFFLLLTGSTWGQSFKDCESGRFFWIFKVGERNFAVSMEGIYQTSEYQNLISVNRYALQHLVVDKSSFRQDDQGTEMELLIAYVLSETEYLSLQFGRELDVQMEKVRLSDGSEALTWNYAMPEGMNENVKNQLYVNLIRDEYIIGFASPQFSDQNFEKVSDFLMDVADTLVEVEDVDSLCNE